MCLYGLAFKLIEKYQITHKGEVVLMLTLSQVSPRSASSYNVQISVTR